jgi:hypothetical protein
MGNFLHAGATAVAGRDDLYCLLDDGTHLTIAGSARIGTTVEDVATGPDGGIYVAYGNYVAKYFFAAGVYALDAAWATAGVLDVGTAIHRLAVDPTDRADGHGAGCLAVAYQSKGAGHTLFSLYDSVGALVWDAAALAYNGAIGFSVKFHPSDGNLVCGRGSFGTSVVLAAVVNRADGALDINLVSFSGTSYGLDSTLPYVYVGTTAGSGALLVKKLDYTAALQWTSALVWTSSGRDVLLWDGACFVAGFGALSTLAKLSDADGTTTSSTAMGGMIYRLVDYGSNLIVCSEPTGVGGDGKVYSLRVLDTGLATVRGSLLPCAVTCVAVGATTAMTIMPQTLFVGGAASKGVRVWKLLDSGVSVSCVDTLLTTVLETNIRDIACSAILDRVFVATDQRVRCYVASTMLLDASWAASGILDVTGGGAGEVMDYIVSIAVDAAGYLAVVGQDTAGSIGQARLYDNTGAQVWLYGTGGATNGGLSVDFLPNGDVLIGYAANTGGVFLLRRHARADGTNLAQTLFSVGASDGAYGVHAEDDAAEHSSVVWSHGASPAQVEYSPAGLAPVVWQQDVLSSTMYTTAILGSSVVAGGTRSTTGPNPTLWKFDKTDGTLLAAYCSGTTAGDYVRRLRAFSSRIYAAGVRSINADGTLNSLHILDANLVYQYGFDTGAALTALDGMFAAASSSMSTPWVAAVGGGTGGGDPVILGTIGLFSVGAPTGVSDAHPVTITVKDSLGATICSKTFDSTTVFPTDGYAVLGGSLAESVSPQTALVVGVDMDVFCELPEFWAIFVYLRDGHLMCSGVRVAAS